VKRFIVLALLLSGCADTQQYLQSTQGKAVFATAETIAHAAAVAAGGPLAGYGLDALAAVAQGYIDRPIPAAIVKASPGITAVANAVAPLVNSVSPVTQADVNTLFKAAAIAANK
jgi:hypothetical protein